MSHPTCSRVEEGHRVALDNPQQTFEGRLIDDRGPWVAHGSADVEKAHASPPAALKGGDWDGPEDPENPLNWPRWQRICYILPPALVCFAATLASSIYTPAYPEVEERFGVSETLAILPLSLYVLALGFGPVIAAPLSETFGRRVVYLISPPLGALFSLGAGFAPSATGLVILRFLAGLCFSPPLAIGAGTIADTNTASERAASTALFILSPFLGPSLGPVIGSFVAARKGWQWTQWTIIFFAIFSWLWVLPMHETYKPVILRRRRAKLGLPDPPSPFASRGARWRFLLTVTLFRPVHMLCVEPIVGLLSVYIAFNFGVLFSFFAAFPYVFGSVYHFDSEQSGLVFLAIGVGCVLAVPTALLCDRFLYQKHVRLSHANGKEGLVAPEHRLYLAMLGSFGLPIGLFWFAWTARSDISWASPVVAAIPFAWGNLSIFISASMYLVDTYQALNGASAVAANGLLRYILGAAFPLFTLQMYRRLTIPWATSLLGFVTVALMPIPWVLFRFGHRIRLKSHYDTIKA
ncbi:MAG: hypothetical protein M1818_004091 [Claussenomyces sp. TS43310]|nr:MAG: hypothetical protein M1818_004091 [Claussenomyces sp. TS43310]